MTEILPAKEPVLQLTAGKPQLTPEKAVELLHKNSGHKGARAEETPLKKRRGRKAKHEVPFNSAAPEYARARYLCTRFDKPFEEVKHLMGVDLRHERSGKRKESGVSQPGTQKAKKEKDLTDDQMRNCDTKRQEVMGQGFNLPDCNTCRGYTRCMELQKLAKTAILTPPKGLTEEEVKDTEKAAKKLQYLLDLAVKLAHDREGDPSDALFMSADMLKDCAECLKAIKTTLQILPGMNTNIVTMNNNLLELRKGLKNLDDSIRKKH